MRLVAWIDRKFYPYCERNWDDQLFRTRILELLQPHMEILDVGAGAGIVEAMNFRGKVRKVSGVDLDPRVERNPYLDEGRLADAGHIPYPDASFDLAFADNVMEHLSAPEHVFREIRRVLKPGGLLIFKTPNRNHYMPLIARLTPHAFHRWFNKLRGRDEDDTFPTHYLANSPRQILDLARVTNFTAVRTELVESRPEYLRLTAFTYLIGLLYERLVNSTEWLAPARILLVATLRRPH